MLTEELLKQVLPNNKATGDLLVALLDVLDNYEINTTNRIAGFLAQCGHESGDFNTLHENLNYSAQGLRGVFPKYFADDATAHAYERQPEKIANRIYANRMGNGPESSGDGYRYRGRGAIQLTGHDNYAQFANSVGKSIPDAITYLETLEGAIESAAWFWKTHGLNATCDADDIVSMTKKINGGTIGLDDRKAKYEKAKSLLG
jgi:putative chitinase